MTTPTDQPMPEPDLAPPPVQEPGHGIGLEPAPAPAPLWRRLPRWALVAGGTVAAVLLLCAGLIVANLDLPTVEPSLSPTPSRPAPRASAPDPAAGWPAFAASGAVPPGVVVVVERVRWDEVALVVETSIVDDADAPDAAVAVCSAVSAYALSGGGFRPVQVLGADDAVMVSRRTLGDSCTWRRD